MISYSEAINSIDSSFLYSCEGETYEGINWQDNRDIPSKVVLDAEIVRLKEEDVAQEYARNRATEYPTIAEQLDEIFHNGIDSWKAVIKVTKDKYPKG